MTNNLRIEKDSMGTIEVPIEALWGAQTQRSIKNFSIGNELIPIELIYSLTLIKKAASIANCNLGLIDKRKKDMIIEAAWASNSFTGQMAFWLGYAAASLTAFYSWRLLIMAFHGKPRCSAEVFEHVHESPPIMILPLIPLAFGAIFAGWFGYQSFVGYDMSYFWGDSLFILPEHHAMAEAHHVAEWVKRLPVILAASGVGLAIIAYLIIPSLPARVVSMARPIHSLFFNKWFFDELYDLLFVRSSVRIGTFLWVKGDEQTIDRFGPDGLSELVLNGSNKLSKLQSGYVYHYAFAMMIGVVMLLSLYFSGFGR